MWTTACHMLSPHSVLHAPPPPPPPGPTVHPLTVKEGSRQGLQQPHQGISSLRERSGGPREGHPGGHLTLCSHVHYSPAPGSHQCRCGRDPAPCRKQWSCRTGNTQTCSVKMALTIGVGSTVVCSHNLTRRTSLAFLNRWLASYRLTKWILDGLFF